MLRRVVKYLGIRLQPWTNLIVQKMHKQKHDIMTILSHALSSLKGKFINNYWMRLCDIRNNEGRGKCYHSVFLTRHVLTSLSVNLRLLLEIMHCTRNLQIIY